MRGALVSTDVAASSYTVDVRPWFRPDGAHGRVTVHTTATTSFEIDGVAATGAAGLAALAAKPAGTMTVAFGTLSTQERRFTAEIVHAGDSVSGERVDAIHGNIVARRRRSAHGEGRVRRAPRSRRAPASNRARQRRAEYESAENRRRSVPCSTRLRCRSVNTSSPSARLTEPATDATPATFDATDGRVRMLPTHLHGAVNAVVPGQINLELRAIDRLGIDLFDFAGTGVTAAQDANPARLRSRDRHARARERRRRRGGSSRRLRAAFRQRAGRFRRPNCRRLSRACRPCSASAGAARVRRRRS